MKDIQRERSVNVRLTVDEANKKYVDRIFGAAFNVCQNQADADDVVQS